MIKAIIFDLDGLIIDSEPFWAQAEIEIFPRYGINVTLEDCKKMQGISIREVVNYWYEKKPWTGASKQQVAQEITDRVVELILTKGKLMPGVITTLEFFRQKALPMAVASSSAPELIELVLKHFDILHYFNFFHSAKHERRGKPFPDVFLTTAKKLGVPAQNCLVFEDSVNGVLAAKNARMKVVAVPYPENFNNPQYKIADLKLHSLTQWDEEKWQYINRTFNL